MRCFPLVHRFVLSRKEEIKKSALTKSGFRTDGCEGQIMHQQIKKHSLPYPAGSLVVLTKICVAKNPITETSSWEDWVAGGENDASLPVLYELRGVLLDQIEINEPIRVFRTHRNGVRADGFFASTIVCSIEGGAFAVTFNSVYLIRPDRLGDTPITPEQMKPLLEKRLNKFQ